MREIVALTFVTLDGVAQGPVQPDEDISGGFAHSGWTFGQIEEAMELVNTQFMTAPISFLFGRKTYEMFAGHWPNASKTSHGDLLNNSQKYVVSSSLSQAHWQNTQIVRGDVVSELKRVKAEDGPRLQVHGSIELIHTLIAHDLIDEFRLLAFPIVLGSGKRLFGGGAVPRRLKLVKSQATKNGIVMGIYRRA